MFLPPWAAGTLGSVVSKDSQDLRKLSAGAQLMAAARGGSWLCPKVEFQVQGEDVYSFSLEPRREKAVWMLLIPARCSCFLVPRLSLALA